LGEQSESVTNPVYTYPQSFESLGVDHNGRFVVDKDVGRSKNILDGEGPPWTTPFLWLCQRGRIGGNCSGGCEPCRKVPARVPHKAIVVFKGHQASQPLYCCCIVDELQIV